MPAADEQISWGWANRANYLKHLWERYKITNVEFDNFWGQQDGRCAGCVREMAHPYHKQAKLGIRPEVDHCHETGKVRGILCRRCNDFLGKIKDSKERLYNLLAYLRRNGEDI